MEIRVGHYYKGFYDNHLYVVEEVNGDSVIIRHLVKGSIYESDIETFSAVYIYYNP